MARIRSVYSVMPTYIFRVRTPDKVAHDTMCHEFPNLDAALIVAVRTARSLVRNPVRRGIKTISGSLDVENEAHQTVARLVLREVAHQIS